MKTIKQKHGVEVGDLVKLKDGSTGIEWRSCLVTRCLDGTHGLFYTTVKSFPCVTWR